MKFDNAQFEASYGTAAQLKPSTLPEIAFSGRSNVGKSSLLNKLLGRKSLARVSSVPGKTVTVNMFKLASCRFVDLPGYGYAKVNDNEKRRWSELMEAYFDSGRDIRLVVQLIDMRHEPTAQDLQMIEYMNEKNIPFVVALTKCDKLNKTERSNQLMSICSVLTKYGNISVIPFSATKGDGVDELRRYIEKAVSEVEKQ
ncbi:MAG: YihA family ribosome biogenesis GTP-binding protein [Clostridia bacterium]|nr:YihA family ribosome biogenesis GTP-binding protein [Clostridia bacterium]